MSSKKSILEAEEDQMRREYEAERIGMTVEEYFNAQMATIEVRLQREGLEYNADGELVHFDSPYAMGVQEGDVIAK